MTTEQIKKLVFELPKKEQADILVELLEAFRSPPQPTGKAWREELRRRIKEVKDGTAILIDGAEARRTLRRKNR